MRLLAALLLLPGAALSQTPQHQRCIQALANIYEAKAILDETANTLDLDNSREEKLKSARVAAGEMSLSLKSFIAAMADYCETKRP